MEDLDRRGGGAHFHLLLCELIGSGRTANLIRRTPTTATRDRPRTSSTTREPRRRSDSCTSAAWPALRAGLRSRLHPPAIWLPGDSPEYPTALLISRLLSSRDCAACRRNPLRDCPTPPR